MNQGGREAAPTVLVTDGDQRAALAIVRSLGAAGYRCVVTGGGRSMAGASHHAANDVTVPHAASAPAKFARAIQELARTERAALLIPVTEASLLALLPERDGIPAHIPFPGLATFQAICDKGRVLEAARTVGIRVPRQETMASSSDTVPTLGAFPVVLKPQRSVYTASDGSRVKIGVRWAYSPAQLAERLASYPDAAYPVHIQEAIVGPGVGVFVLIHNGDLIASFSHRRLREVPPTGGVSVLRQSEPMNQALLDRSLALLGIWDWSGPAMVEYKLDERTGEPVLMEINGRFWGSLQLAIDAGVDFPRLLADSSLGRSIQTVDHYRSVRSRWFWGDVDHLIATWRNRELRWSQRLKPLNEFLRAFGPRYRSEVFRWGDPGPFFRETISWFASLRK